LTDSQEKAFESGVPTARVVRLLVPTVYLSNEADVLLKCEPF
jgi:hypothetical protein